MSHHGNRCRDISRSTGVANVRRPSSAHEGAAEPSATSACIRRSGFTLLELLLTLSLSVVLMILVGGVIEFYGRDMTNSDMEVRQVQLASAVMQMIEDDLRATLHAEPVDTSGLESLLSSVGSSAGAGGGDDAAAGTEEALPEETEEETSTADASSSALLSGAAVLQTPGLIGNQYQLQIDVSKLPRLEEYVLMFDENNADLEDIPSDIKTISYFVQGEGNAGVADPLTDVGNRTVSGSRAGLVRRVLDRAATVQAVMVGGVSRLNQTGDLLAPEVVGIEFSYWDGFAWQIEWSSDEYGELPLAVKVTLTMLDGTAVSPSGEPGLRTFAHVVRLPMARPIEIDDSTTTEVGG